MGSGRRAYDPCPALQTLLRNTGHRSGELPLATRPARLSRAGKVASAPEELCFRCYLVSLYFKR